MNITIFCIGVRNITSMCVVTVSIREFMVRHKKLVKRRSMKDYDAVFGFK
jgi:hypothetical protein